MSQRESVHRPEQHSVFPPHVLPEVLHSRLSEPQVPPSHCPLQHSAPDWHAPESETQASAWQISPLQVRPQQSVGDAHGVPGAPQASETAAHVFVVG